MAKIKPTSKLRQALHFYSYICIFYSYLKGKSILKKLWISIFAFVFSIYIYIPVIHIYS